ncbi:neuromedin-S-like [Paramormyrops kingsleyae]|uniref:neuromedin-S n=1 Tax=Paramormyrops kingsleyae TaxID=1676925 RepID=UPI000CD63DE7|nr:neuromedin-S isoform X1 [Paramormyrops kingsleyae]
MRRKIAHQVNFILLVYCLLSLPVIMGFPRWLPGCVEGFSLTQVPGLQKTMCGLVWRDQEKDKIQDVYKRFLFHYSKAQNSLRSMQRESQSVHPLMRLYPKLSQKRRKQPAPWRS